MSQYWKKMNNNGKYVLSFGILMTLGGFTTFFDDNRIWLMLLIVCTYYVAWAGWDDRFNINYVKGGA